MKLKTEQVNTKVGANQRRLTKTILSLMLALGMSLGGASVTHAEIYKIVDANGAVSYTDKPPRDLARGATSTTMKIKLHNSYQARQTPQRQASQDEGIPEIPGSDIYQDLAITSPTPSTSLRSNNGSLTLTARLAPSLRPGHKMRFFLDGRPVGDVNGTSLAVTDVPRGGHSVAAIVVDIEGRPLKNSEVINFTLQRTSQLTPSQPPPRPAPSAGSTGGA